MAAGTIQIELSPRREIARQLFAQGWRDIDIARELGISRERVRQFRVGVNVMAGAPFEAREWQPIQHGKAGVSETAIRRWALAGLIEISPSGLVKEADCRRVAAELRARKCEACDRKINAIDPRVRWCHVHRVQVRKNGYRFLGEDYKRRHNEATRQYAERHREETRYNNARAHLVYRLVKQGKPRNVARRMALRRYPKQ